jgi:hypothetical protein
MPETAPLRPRLRLRHSLTCWYQEAACTAASWDWDLRENNTRRDHASVMMMTDEPASCMPPINKPSPGAGLRWTVSASEQRFRPGVARAWNRVFRLAHVTGTRSVPRRLAGCAHMHMRLPLPAAGSERARTPDPAAIHMGPVRACDRRWLGWPPCVSLMRMQRNHATTTHACVWGARARSLRCLLACAGR